MALAHPKRITRRGDDALPVEEGDTMIARTALLTLLVSTLVACDSSPIATEPTPSATPTVTPESSQALPTAIAIAPTPTPKLLTTQELATGSAETSAEIPPCTPAEGSAVDPRETTIAREGGEPSLAAASAALPKELSP